MKRLLLDENLPKRLENSFFGDFEVTSVPDPGWQSKHNGELLLAMKQEGLEYLLTADRNLRHQRNLARLGIRVVLILSHDTRLKALIHKVEKVEKAIMNFDMEVSFVEVDLR